MTHHWLIITFSWFGTASLQYINTGGPGSDVGFDMMDGVRYPVSNFNYNPPQLKNDFPTLQMDPLTDQFYHGDPLLVNKRKRRMLEDKNVIEGPLNSWVTSTTNENPTNLLAEYTTVDNNDGSHTLYDATMLEKKYFSPWGGKRNKPLVERNMWSWKRSSNIREPSMPKRVRFSPWGGKRSGPMVYKPGVKNPKIIFSSSIPELRSILSNFLPNGKRIDIAGFELIPIWDKLNHVKILALSSNVNGRPSRNAMPFKNVVDEHETYKPGHPYQDVNLKKDGKRKVKFSAWGGKRSPPIIGPIWTPNSEDVKEDTVKAIYLLGNSDDQKDKHNPMNFAS